MKYLKQQFKLLWRTRQCSLVLILLLLGTTGFGLYKFFRLFMLRGATFDVTTCMTWSLKWQIYGFIAFVFVAFEYYSQARRNDIDEVLNVSRLSAVKRELIQFSCLMLVNILYFVLHYLIFILYGYTLKQLTIELVVYTCKLYSIYIVGLFTVAILAGYLLSKVKGNVVGYVLLVLVAFLATVRAQQILPDKEIIGAWSDLTQIFCVGANWTMNASFLYPVELHFFVKTMLIVCLQCMIVAFLWYIIHKKPRYLIGVFVMGVLCIGMYCVWNNDVTISGSFYGYHDAEDILYDDKENVNSDFYVLNYDIKLGITSYMDVEAAMELSNSTLEKYCFTLFSGFDISSITDEQGNALDYEVDGNGLIVYNRRGEFRKIIVKYAGIGTNQYFAGAQGICLPGNFPYYPIVGIRRIAEQGLCELPAQESTFHVVLDSNLNIYSNLMAVGKDELMGKSNNFTLVGGYWTKQQIGDITYLYPTYSSSYNPEINTFLREGVETYWFTSVENTKIDYTLTDKLIVIAPYEMEGGHYMFGSDTVVVGTKYDLDNYYMHYLETGKWHMTVDEQIDAIP